MTKPLANIKAQLEVLDRQMEARQGIDIYKSDVRILIMLMRKLIEYVDMKEAGLRDDN